MKEELGVAQISEFFENKSSITHFSEIQQIDNYKYLPTMKNGVFEISNQLVTLEGS